MMNVPELALISVKPPPALKGIEPQSDVLDFLDNPSSYGVDISRVERLDTHGSYIFLAGDNVFKVKRGVLSISRLLNPAEARMGLSSCGYVEPPHRTDALHRCCRGATSG
jgi:hypothetical protein